MQGTRILGMLEGRANSDFLVDQVQAVRGREEGKESRMTSRMWADGSRKRLWVKWAWGGGDT